MGRLGRVVIPAGGARHQIAVTEPCPQLAPEKSPMVFDVGAGLYWRPEDGGILFGMSNPDEEPGVARNMDWEYLALIRERLAVPGSRRVISPCDALGLQRSTSPTIFRSSDLHSPHPPRAPDSRMSEPVPSMVTMRDPGDRDRRFVRRLRRWSRNDVGPGCRSCERRSLPEWQDRHRRHLVCRPRPLRLRRPQPPCARPDSPSVPRNSMRSGPPKRSNRVNRGA